MPPTVHDPATRSALIARLRRLRPDAPARWGRMTAPQALAHLCAQMRHTMGDEPCAPRAGPLRWPMVKWAAIYWLPWPRGRVRGPAEAFATPPGDWAGDLGELERLVQRFVEREPEADWPPHALFGPMSGRDWGAFIHKHFDHHLRQFGA